MSELRPKGEAARLTRRELFAFLGLLALFAAVPWCVPYWPSQDGQNHLAVAYVLRHFNDAGAPFSKYLTIQTGVRPSTAVYTVLTALADYADLGTIEKAMVSFAIVLVPVAALLFVHRAAPRRASAVLLTLPSAIGWSLAMGFLGFEIALGFGILTLALAWAGADPEGRISFWHIVAAVAFFLCVWFHPFTAVMTGVALLLLEWRNVTRAKVFARLLLVCGPGALFLIVMYLLAGAPPHASAMAPETFWADPFQAAFSLLEFNTAYSVLELVPRLGALGILGYFAYRELRARWALSRAMASHWAEPFGPGAEGATARVVVGFLALYMVMPLALAGWFYCSTRFLMVALLLLPAVAPLPEAWRRRVVPAAVGLSLLVAAVEGSDIVRTSGEMQDIVKVGSVMPRGAKLIPMDFSARLMGPQPLGHSWALLVRTRDAVASQLFAAGKPRMGGERFRTLSFLPGVLDSDKGELPWSSYETWYDVTRGCRSRESERCRHALAERTEILDTAMSRYDYVLMIAPPPFILDLFGARLSLAAKSGGVSLFAARHGAPGAAP